MIKTEKCEVCKEAVQKYRCPKCRIVYCSVPCFKQHKDDCNTPQETTTDVKVDHVSPASDKDGIIPDFTLGDDNSEDRVSLEKLKDLESSQDLKERLANPHLRQMLTSLVNARDPTQLIEKSMQEPLFSEFVDTCLTVIDEGGTEEME